MQKQDVYVLSDTHKTSKSISDKQHKFKADVLLAGQAIGSVVSSGNMRNYCVDHDGEHFSLLVGYHTPKRLRTTIEVA
jgi:hypothetical protein